MQSQTIMKINDLCRLCKSSKVSIQNIKQTGFDKFNFFDYLFCFNCSSLSIRSIPDNISEYYNGYYSYSKFDATSRFCIEKYMKYFFYKNKLIFSFFKKNIKNIYDFNLKALLKLNLNYKSKILDVGSGSGKFIYDLYNIGFCNALGIDPYIEKSLSYHNGAKVEKIDLFKISDKFDIITFNHTLEHMDDLQKVFFKIKDLLNIRGYCIIRIPNIDSYAFKKFGNYWTGIHAPYHFCLPSYNAILQLAHNVGLKLENMHGEQVPGFFLANVENQLNIIEPETMFIKFHFSHTREDIKYWKRKAKKIIKHPKLCEWAVYYLHK